MKTIRKTPQKATYFEGNFELRSRENTNWAHPINFPTVFTAHGAAIKSGNWQSCTAINTPQYVIDNYFDGKLLGMGKMWNYCKQLENTTWEDVERDPEMVQGFINLANGELDKLKTL